MVLFRSWVKAGVNGLARVRVVLPVVLASVLLLHHYANTRRLEAPEWMLGGHCQPQANIAFLKTHKCASSAIQNILFRYGQVHGLSFALPDAGNYFGGVKSFRADMVRLTPWYALGNNIFAVHTKWDFDQVKSLMAPNTTFFTIVRDPIDVFESLYTYSKFEKEYGKNLSSYVLDTPADAKRKGGYLGYNQMTWDFGLPEEHMTNITAAKELVERAAAQFPLVLVAERMDESLVLLSHLLCWDLRDVLVLRVNARATQYKTELSEATRAKLRQKLSLDYFLYDHFRARFDEQVQLFGRRRMAEEVRRLRALSAHLEEMCGFVEKSAENMVGPNKPWSNMVGGFQPTSGSEMCSSFTRSELAFINLLRGKQRMEAIQKFGPPKGVRLDALPLGAVALGGGAEDTIRRLRENLVHSEDTPQSHP